MKKNWKSGKCRSFVPVRLTRRDRWEVLTGHMEKAVPPMIIGYYLVALIAGIR